MNEETDFIEGLHGIEDTADVSIIEFMDKAVEEFLLDFSENWSSVIGIRCAAHSIQLIVVAALKGSTNTKTAVDLCRMTSKAMRQQSVINALIQNKIPTIVPRMDCITRWSSTYMMVGFLILLYDIILNDSERNSSRKLRLQHICPSSLRSKRFEDTDLEM